MNKLVSIKVADGTTLEWFEITGLVHAQIKG